MYLALSLMAAGGIIVAVIGWLGIRGLLPPNHLAGIRTPYTMSSREAWYATHRAGGPVLLATGAIVLLGAVVAITLVALLGLAGLTASVLPAALAIVLVAGAITSWLVGTRRARRQLGGR